MIKNPPQFILLNGFKSHSFQNPKILIKSPWFKPMAILMEFKSMIKTHNLTHGNFINGIQIHNQKAQFSLTTLKVQFGNIKNTIFASNIKKPNFH